MTDVFISYSRKDTEFVRRLFDDLKTREREAWVDWQGIDYSTKWWEEICAGIEGADNFVLILSPDSLNSIYCHREIEHARKHNKRIIPFIYRPWDEKSLVGGWYTVPEMRPHEPMARENWEALKAIQYIDYPGKLNADFTQAIDALLNTVDTDSGRVKLHTRLSLRIRDWEARGRSPSALLRGDELITYEAWLAQTDAANDEPCATDDQRAYITSSRETEDKYKSRALTLRQEKQELARQIADRTQQFRFAAVILGIVGILVFGIVVFAIGIGLSEVQRSRTSIESLRLAFEANEILQEEGGNVETAALLSIRALNSVYSSQADAVLVQAVERLYTRQVFPGSMARLSANFSQDSHSIMITDYSGTQLWNTDSGKLIRAFPDSRDIFSLDGRYALTKNGKGIIQLQDSYTGETLRSISGNQGIFSPDGHHFLINNSNNAYLFDIESGDEELVFSGNFFSGYSIVHQDGVFSPNGRYILTIDDNILRVWDIQSGKEIQAFSSSTYTTENLQRVRFSPNSLYVLTQNILENFRLWDIQTGKELHNFPGYTAEFSPDGNRIFIEDGLNNSHLFDTQSGEELQKFSGYSVKFSPDGQYILLNRNDDNSILLDILTGQELRSFPGFGLAFSSNGQYLLIRNNGNNIQLWDWQTGEMLKVFSGDTSYIRSAVFSPDGHYVLTTSDDDTRRLWDVAPREDFHLFPYGADNIKSAVFSPDGRYVLTANLDKTARLWDAQTGQELRVLSGHIAEIESAVFSPDGRYVLTASLDKTARLWDAQTGQELHSFTDNIHSWSSAIFSPDASYILTSSSSREGGSINLWDKQTGKKMYTFDSSLRELHSVIFSPDSQSFLTFRNKFVIEMGVQTGEVAGFVWGDSANFSPDGTAVLTINNDRTVRLWDTSIGLQLRIFTGHTNKINSAYFSSDARKIITASDDNTARVWDSQTGTQLRVFSGHTDNVSNATLSPDGQYVLTFSQDGTARIWDTDYPSFLAYACTRVFRDFTPEERTQYSLDDSPTCPQFAATSG
jgi:WD40 repeat protein